MTRRLLSRIVPVQATGYFLDLLFFFALAVVAFFSLDDFLLLFFLPKIAS